MNLTGATLICVSLSRLLRFRSGGQIWSGGGVPNPENHARVFLNLFPLKTRPHIGRCHYPAARGGVGGFTNRKSCPSAEVANSCKVSLPPRKKKEKERAFSYSYCGLEPDQTLFSTTVTFPLPLNRESFLCLITFLSRSGSDSYFWMK